MRRSLGGGAASGLVSIKTLVGSCLLRVELSLKTTPTALLSLPSIVSRGLVVGCLLLGEAKVEFGELKDEFVHDPRRVSGL